MNQSDRYLSLNALSSFKDADGHYNFGKDKEAVAAYMEDFVQPHSRTFASVKERLNFLFEHDYYEKEVFDRYSEDFIESLYTFAKEQNFTFPSLMGAMKFYAAYALKADDNGDFLETYSDRVIANALFLAKGDEDLARHLAKDILANRFQPATPTFLNAAKKRRGEYISCYLLRVEDNMESISRSIATSLQLSKRGGGVALCLTNLRETGAPIKGMPNQSSGVIPVMKLLEDSFSYANQLGQRQGAGAVYLHANHPDILKFLDTKRENADEKIRIKSLSLGVVVPDICFQLAKENKDMALFSPYDIERVYGKPMTDISITDEYDHLLANPAIKKTYLSARKFFTTIAELHFESGYPYILFEDTVNRRNPHAKRGRIVMSNLCSEITQVSTPSTYKEDLSFDEIGEDICCNLGSLNIAKAMETGAEFGELIAHSIQALDRISRESDLACAPSIANGNQQNHAIGLGAMNLHGFLATEHIYYDSKEAVDFTDTFFYCLAYHAFKASCDLAKQVGPFKNFEQSAYADGTYFKKYTDQEFQVQTSRVEEVFEQYGVTIPSRSDWEKLAQEIQTYGVANAHLLAVAPTGSISYLSSCTPSLQAVVAPVETRKEGKLGRLYVPAYQIDQENYKYYARGAYEVGPQALIDIAAAAQKHVDQAIALTLFMTSEASTRDLNKAYIYAYKKGCSSIYYVRVRQDVLKGSEKLDDDVSRYVDKGEKHDPDDDFDGPIVCEACMI